jgi:hypothetical protein
MLCTRLDYWDEKYDVLSYCQYGFRKSRETKGCLQRMCRPLLKESIHSEAYDNVLIDILCDILREKEVPMQVVRFLFRLLWRMELGFFAGGRECMTLAGYKGLPQGSVLTTFL